MITELIEHIAAAAVEMRIRQPVVQRTRHQGPCGELPASPTGLMHLRRCCGTARSRAGIVRQ